MIDSYLDAKNEGMLVNPNELYIHYPEIFNENKFSGILTCNCEDYNSRIARYIRNDHRSFCNHIILKILNSFNYLLDDFTKLLFEAELTNRFDFIFRHIVNSNIYYFGVVKKNFWINVFINQFGWKIYKFNFQLKRWKFNQSPPDGKNIELIIMGKFSKFF